MRYIVWLALATLLPACVLVDDDGFDDRRTLAQGYTPCNDAPLPTDGVICAPNQYCADQKLNWCFRGCLSDDNCSSEQICSKGHGDDVGTCITWDDARPIYDDLEPGYTKCGDERIPADFAICQPSQYCAIYREGSCASGCLSEDNCTENQQCIKQPGENVGVCDHI